MAGILVEDIFDVKDIDPTGKKFERGILPSVLFLFHNPRMSIPACRRGHGQTTRACLRLVHVTVSIVWTIACCVCEVVPFFAWCSER